jgi:hypothetical protein
MSIQLLCCATSSQKNNIRQSIQRVSWDALDVTLDNIDCLKIATNGTYQGAWLVINTDNDSDKRLRALSSLIDASLSLDLGIVPTPSFRAHYHVTILHIPPCADSSQLLRRVRKLDEGAINNVIIDHLLWDGTLFFADDAVGRAALSGWRWVVVASHIFFAAAVGGHVVSAQSFQIFHPGAQHTKRLKELAGVNEKIKTKRGSKCIIGACGASAFSVSVAYFIGWALVWPGIFIHFEGSTSRKDYRWTWSGTPVHALISAWVLLVSTVIMVAALIIVIQPKTLFAERRGDFYFGHVRRRSRRGRHRKQNGHSRRGSQPRELSGRSKGEGGTQKCCVWTAPHVVSTLGLATTSFSIYDSVAVDGLTAGATVVSFVSVAFYMFMVNKIITASYSA